MKNTKLMVGALALVLATLATVFAAGRGSINTAKCYPTDDGKFICKATGDVMEKPCCENSCCDK